MATINFYLDKPKSKTPTAIYLRYYNGTRMKFRTGEYCLPSKWNFDQALQIKKGYCKDPVLNDTLGNLKTEVEKAYRNYKITEGHEPSNQYMKEQINNLLSRQEEAKEDNTFIGLLDFFIEDNKERRQEATLKTYRTLRTHLQDFAKKTRYKVEFASINAQFRDQFHKYLIKEKRMGDSSIQKVFSILKRFLNFAAELGHNPHTEYLKFKFKRNNVTKVALTEEELQAIKDLDLSNDSCLDRVRDFFVFGCETSLRFSDLQNLKPTNIKEDRVDGTEVIYIDLVAVKTRGAILAPLSEEAIRIVEKYEGDKDYCFPRISNQKFNAYIKDVCLMAGIVEEIQLVKHIGKDRIEEVHPKCDLISSHTQRRTFVTLFFERGGSVEECMIYTGHKSYKELQTYQKKTTHHRLKLALRAAPNRFRKVS